MKYRIKECTIVYSTKDEIRKVKYFVPQYKRFLFWHNFTYGDIECSVDFKTKALAEQYIRQAVGRWGIKLKPVYYEVDNEI